MHHRVAVVILLLRSTFASQPVTTALVATPAADLCPSCSCDGFGHLHVAAATGDIITIAHLLEIQCPADFPYPAPGALPRSYRYSASPGWGCYLNMYGGCDKSETALHIAAKKGQAGAVAALLLGKPASTSDSQSSARNQADPNKQRGDGMTALHIAAENGEYDICKQLLVARASPDPLMQVTAATPLMLAAKQRHGEIVELLLANGAKIMRNDAHGERASDYAQPAAQWSSWLAQPTNPALEILMKEEAKYIAGLQLQELVHYPAIKVLQDQLRGYLGVSGSELRASVCATAESGRGAPSRADPNDQI